MPPGEHASAACLQARTDYTRHGAPPRPVGHAARGAADASMTNENSKENLTGRSRGVLAVMADDSELTLISGPFSYTVLVHRLPGAGRSRSVQLSSTSTQLCYC